MHCPHRNAYLAQDGYYYCRACGDVLPLLSERVKALERLVAPVRRVLEVSDGQRSILTTYAARDLRAAIQAIEGYGGPSVHRPPPLGGDGQATSTTSGRSERS